MSSSHSRELREQLLCIDYPVELEVLLAEIHEEPQLEAARLQIVYQLGLVGRMPSLDGFDLDHDLLVNQQIDHEVPNQDSVVEDLDRILLPNIKANLAKLMG